MPETPDRATFRLPRTTYLVVVFFAVGVWPLALSGGRSGAGSAGPAVLSGLIALFVLPVVVAAFIARTGTDVDASAGITVRALFGSRTMPWTGIRGVSVQGSKVYAVLPDGAVRLPCVQISHLAELARAAGEHLPDLPPPRVKQPPARRRRG